MWKIIGKLTGILVICSVFFLPSFVSAQETKPKQAADKLYSQGISALQEDKVEQALEYFNKALQINPGYKMAWAYKGFILKKLGKYEEELRCYDKFIEIDPANEVVWNNRGVTLLSLHKYQESENSFRRAEMLKPKYPETFYNRGILRLETGNYKEALKDFTKSIRLGTAMKENADVHISWCNRLIRQIDGINIPPKNWEPNYYKYNSIVEAETKDHPLIDMPEPNYKPKPDPSGLPLAMPLTGYAGTKIRLKGTQEEPFLYAPKFYVWDGSVINDYKYGVLLENGTKFKYVKIEGAHQIISLGVIEGWKAKVTSKREMK